MISKRWAPWIFADWTLTRTQRKGGSQSGRAVSISRRRRVVGCNGECACKNLFTFGFQIMYVGYVYQFYDVVSKREDLNNTFEKS